MKRNIINLSNFFIKETFSRMDIFEKGKLNKKSSFFWIIIMLSISIYFLSNEAIQYLVQGGTPEIFLRGYFLFIKIILTLQVLIMYFNAFYFSKDIENILPLPFKPVEILISRFNTTMIIVYSTELILSIIPFCVYGYYTFAGIGYYINLLFCLILFPIFIVSTIGIIMTFFMKLIKIFNNKDFAQLIVSTLLIILFIGFIYFQFKITFKGDNIFNLDTTHENVFTNVDKKIEKIDKNFLIINPIIEILKNDNIIINYLKIIIINLNAFSIFVILGNKLYLKQLLESSFYEKKYKNKKYKGTTKKKIKSIAYLKKDIKKLIKNPIFFMQSIYPIVLAIITVSAIFMMMAPKIIEILQREEYRESLANLKFDFEAICLILGALQFVGLFNYSSVTAFSRDGKDAYFMKVIPIDLYKQFVYKNIPQVFINTISSIFILGIIKYEIPAIEIKYVFIIFGLSFLMYIINSYILCLIDLLNPKINWDAEYEIMQNNKNKLLQYVLIIFNILFLYYFDKLFIGKNLKLSIIIFGSILIFILIIFNLIKKKFKNKLFKKII